MSETNDEFRPRLGRIARDNAAPPRSLASQLRRIGKSGGSLRRRSTPKFQAWQGTRRAVIKARVVGLSGKGLALQRAHLGYLQREGAGERGERADFYNGSSDGVDGKDWLKAGAEDRHHFRFIVSAEDGDQLSDLKPFIRSLVREMESDLGTRLDWIAVDHHNTDHPHSHILMRGVRDDGRDLVMDRDYISSGIRARASQILTRELGLETAEEIEFKINRAIPARRVTNLDRQMMRQSRASSTLDLADVWRRRMHYRARLQVLERLGLAERAGAGRWQLKPDLIDSLSRLEQQDVAQARIRVHLREVGPNRAEGFNFDAQAKRRDVVGRVFAMGLANEHTGSVYALVDGLDGRVHHFQLAGDKDLKSGEWVRIKPDSIGRLGSVPPLGEQVKAAGRTMLDEWLAGKQTFDASRAGLGAEFLSAARDRHADLVRRGLVQPRELPDAQLLAKLDWEAMHTEGARIAAEMGMAYRPAKPGEELEGYFEREFTSQAGRFAVVERDLEFSLVPWKPEFEHRRYTQIAMTIERDLSISRMSQRSLGLGR
ncbi:MAG: DUF3363 domain-containing protein [Acidobacteria bacterium]|nr:DUF3363 domain-containing protein [Acidobacteriota bacterium]